MCSAFPALLAVVLARNGQLLATLGSAGCQYATAIGSGHSLTETVLVYAATVVGLKCSFHNSMLFCLFVIVLSRRPAFGTGSSVSGCKIRHFFSISQTLVRFSLFLGREKSQNPMLASFFLPLTFQFSLFFVPLHPQNERITFFKSNITNYHLL